MTYDDLISHYKTPATAAAALNTDRQRVFGWKKLARIPTDAQIEIELATHGLLRADIPEAIRARNRIREQRA